MIGKERPRGEGGLVYVLSSKGRYWPSMLRCRESRFARGAGLL